ncbi:MAG: precorrin-2 C(20)-methyltransferase [Deltaproteobacteria bacterium RIFCSPLOWO2_02_FULL_53_8]|nr:MAG: precorrin-2 C(20)-methyltransferase [Deltaproteobacteria bacterium RIFCSPLOWO2_02_FULL_53_8]
MLKTGRLYGVGVGPGEAELITIKAARVINDSPVIAIPKSADSSADGRSKALVIVEQLIALDAKEILELDFPMTRDKDALLASRAKAAGAICLHLKAGRDVVFITLGDPLFYSTFGCLVPFVRQAAPEAVIEAVPGVTSFCASAAAAMMPIAEAGESVAVIPAAYDLEDVRAALSAFDTVILMKVNKVIDKVVALLIETGLERKAVFVSRAGWSEERVVTDVASLKGEVLDYFSLIIIRKGT